MDGPPGRIVAANGLRHHVLVAGDGPGALVVLHKLTGGGETWWDEAVELAGALGCRVVLPDLRGHGWTDSPAAGYSLVDYARDVAGIAEALGLRRPVVAGHSLGARVALRLGARHPGSVAAVAALDPPVSGPGRGRYPYSLESFTSWRADVEARGVAACLGGSTPYTPRQAELRCRYGLRYAPQAVTESWWGFHLEDAHELVAGLRVPALLLRGERGVVPPEAAAELAGLSDRLDVREVPGAGHNVHVDRWPEVRAALLDFARPHLR